MVSYNKVGARGSFALWYSGILIRSTVGVQNMPFGRWTSMWPGQRRYSPMVW